jgi:hypothetical protein
MDRKRLKIDGRDEGANRWTSMDVITIKFQPQRLFVPKMGRRGEIVENAKPESARGNTEDQSRM